MRVGLIWLVLVGVGFGQKVAVTFDDLPSNGSLAASQTMERVARDVVKILKKRHVPPAYGFINAVKLEGSADGAAGLSAWAAGEPVGNHTYVHMNLSENPAELFEKNIAQNEPVLELLSASTKNGATGNAAKRDWHWFRYPYLNEGDTLEKRRAVREYLAKRGYRIAEVTMDWEDYLWNFAAAKCEEKHDAKAMQWLHDSYLKTASTYIDFDRELAKQVYGREINHVLLLHLGAYSTTILPEMFDLLKKKGLTLVTLEEAESDPAYGEDPDVASKDGGSLTDLMLMKKGMKFPEVEPKPYKELKEICQ